MKANLISMYVQAFTEYTVKKKKEAQTNKQKRETASSSPTSLRTSKKKKKELKESLISMVFISLYIVELQCIHHK